MVCTLRSSTNLQRLGQVGGVAISSAVFQSKLDNELRARIHTPDADEVGSTLNCAMVVKRHGLNPFDPS
jgi:hypothetical protein